MKKKMRKSILTRRKSMTQGEVDSLSKMICQRIIDYHFLEDITDVCLYMPIQNEVNLSELISILHNNNKTVWLPRIFSDKMDFFLFDKKDNDDKSTPLLVCRLMYFVYLRRDFLVPLYF